MKELWTKIKEALISALPITAIVYIMSLTPLFDFSAVELITFTIGAVMLILGIGLFNMGADLAMTPMGEQVGSGLPKSGKFKLLLIICFMMGVAVTIAEPDLSVLASQVKEVVSGTTLIVTIGVGVFTVFGSTAAKIPDTVIYAGYCLASLPLLIAFFFTSKQFIKGLIG